MIKEFPKVVIIILFILFLFFYFFGNNIYQNELVEKKDLTIEQIKKFENDVKNGIEIDINDYVVKDKSYDNNVTRLNDNISNFIELGFRKIFKYLLSGIDSN